MRISGWLLTSALSGLLACGEEPLSFVEEPRPCEELGEICPASAPIMLELAELDGDGVADFITAGLGWQLSVASLIDGDYTYATTSVPVEWGNRLLTCSSGEGPKNLVLYQRAHEWWLWRLTAGRLELVDSGRPDLGTVVFCLDLGPGVGAIVTLNDTTLVLPTMTFELQPLGSTLKGQAAMATSDGARLSLFRFVIPNPDPHVTTFDLELGSIAGEDSWSLNLGRIDLLVVAGDDIVVAGRTDSNPELVIVRDVDPAAPVADEIDRVPLPWQASLLEIAELDGDADLEIVVAPMPVTAIAVYGLSDSPTALTIVELEFEAIDIATGDHDGDGKDEIYALDPRDERIIEVQI